MLTTTFKEKCVNVLDANLFTVKYVIALRICDELATEYCVKQLLIDLAIYTDAIAKSSIAYETIRTGAGITAFKIGTNCSYIAVRSTISTFIIVYVMHTCALREGQVFNKQVYERQKYLPSQLPLLL